MSNRFKEAPRASRSRDEREVRSIHQRMIEAWNSGDGDAFAGPFTRDADFVAFEGTHLWGREEVAAFHRDIFAAAMKGSRLAGEVKFIRFPGEKTALMYSLAQVKMPAERSPTPSRDSMQLTVLRLRDGVWRVVALMNARRLTLERQLFFDDLEALPQRVRDSLIDLAVSYRRNIN